MSRDSTQEVDKQDITRTPENEDNQANDDVVNAGIDPRQAQMNDLVKRRREERAEEEGEQFTEEDDELKADPPKTETPPPEKEWYERDGKAYMRLKVDGEEQEFDLGKVKATAQKNLAADKRLAEAANRERAIEERERLLLQRESAAQQVQSKPPVVTGASDDVEAKVDSTLNAIYSGDEAAAKKALIELLAGRQQPTQAPDDLDNRVRQAASAAIAQEERKRELNSGVSRFKTEFNDIASDPELWGMADRYTLDIVKEHPDYDPYQIMQAAGNKVRDWLKTHRGDASLSDRTQRKRQAMGTVGGANRPASLGKDEPAPKTRGNVIEDMKRARGQMI
ncbi:MAG: hypothetical protein ACJA1I_000505 [Zhongshania marina]|jgi:hypothetical protein